MDKLTRINALFLVLRAFQAQLTTEGTFFAADGETEPTHHQSAVDYGRIIVADDSVHICSMLESCPSLMRKDSTGNSNEISTWKKLQGTVPSKTSGLFSTAIFPFLGNGVSLAFIRFILNASWNIMEDRATTFPLGGCSWPSSPMVF